MFFRHVVPKAVYTERDSHGQRSEQNERTRRTRLLLCCSATLWSRNHAAKWLNREKHWNIGGAGLVNVKDDIFQLGTLNAATTSTDPQDPTVRGAGSHVDS